MNTPSMYKCDPHGHRVLGQMNFNQLATPFQMFDHSFDLQRHDEDIHPFNWNNSQRPQRLRNGLETVDFGRSQVECTKDLFQVKLDVQHFAPQEIDVKVVEDCVVIEGKQDEKLDHHGHVTNEFTRKYHLPSNQTEDVSCSMGSDGFLCISGKGWLVLPAPGGKETPLAI